MTDSDPTPKPRVIFEAFNDVIEFTHGVGAGKQNAEGVLEEAHSAWEDRRRWTGSRLDLTASPPRLLLKGVQATKPDRQDKVDEENEAGAALAAALSQTLDVEYLAEEKEEEDSKYPDIWLRNTRSGAKVGVQIRHFDTTAIRDLSVKREFEQEVSADSIAKAICDAIEAKNKIDPTTAGVSYLLLISPYPLPIEAHPLIAEAVGNRSPGQKYMETWVASWREPAFRVQSVNTPPA